MKWVYLVLAIVGELVGTSALKGAEGFTRLWPSLISIAGYVVAFYFLSLSLEATLRIKVYLYFIPININLVLYC